MYKCSTLKCHLLIEDDPQRQQQRLLDINNARARANESASSGATDATTTDNLSVASASASAFSSASAAPRSDPDRDPGPDRGFDRDFDGGCYYLSEATTLAVLLESAIGLAAADISILGFGGKSDP